MHGIGVTLRHFRLYLSASYNSSSSFSIHSSSVPSPFSPKNVFEVAVLINQDADSHAKYNLLYRFAPVQSSLPSAVSDQLARTFSLLSS